MADVLIVGAGPAGLSAAISCAENGLQVKILDEFVKPGGRLLGQLHQEPDGKWWNGIEEAEKLHEKALSLGIDIELGASVYDVQQTEQGWKIYSTSGIDQAPSLLLATGAAECPVPVPGWTLPGVMSIGAAQVMTNVHRVSVGKRGVIIGINVLSAAIARELELAGIELAAMVLPGKNILNEEAANPLEVMKSMARVAHLAPSSLARLAGKMMKSPSLRKLGVRLYPEYGIKIWGIPVQLRKSAVQIYGTSRVEGVRIATVTASGEVIPGTEADVPADFVCIAGGLYPLVELAAVAGCSFQRIPELGGHVPVHNRKMQTMLKGLYVAGNITGIENAKVAIAQGTVAGLSISLDRMTERSKSLEKCSMLLDKLEQAVNHVQSVREKALIHFHPNVLEGRKKMEALWREKINGQKKDFLER